MKTVLLTNPAAGAGRAGGSLAEIESVMQQRGISFDSWRSERPDDLATLARRASASFERLIVVGGDGTLQKVLAGLLPDTSLSLGIVPCGTGNDFAKMLGLGSNWRAAIERAVGERTRPVDVGRLHTETGNYYFLNGFGCGFDADIVRVSQRAKWLPPALVYPFALFRQWLTGVQTRSVVVTDAEREIAMEMTLCAAANGQYYGGAFRLNPTAAIDDGRLDLLLAAGLNRSGILAMLPRLMRGSHLQSPHVTHWQSAGPVSIRSAEPLPIQLDGELIPPARELSVSLLPAALSVAR